MRADNRLFESNHRHGIISPLSRVQFHYSCSSNTTGTETHNIIAVIEVIVMKALLITIEAV